MWICAMPFDVKLIPTRLGREVQRDYYVESVANLNLFANERADGHISAASSHKATLALKTSYATYGGSTHVRK